MSEHQLRRIKVATQDAVREGAGTVVRVEDNVFALFRVGGRCFATANACPHRGGPLGEGELEGYIVTCPWHGWTWDIRTGTNVRQPTVPKLACFPVTEENGDILIDVPAL